MRTSSSRDSETTAPQKPEPCLKGQGELVGTLHVGGGGRKSGEGPAPRRRRTSATVQDAHQRPCRLALYGLGCVRTEKRY
jgi:hypothetical protein